MKQQTLTIAADQGEGFEQHRRSTRRDVVLSTMEQLVPWSDLCAVIEPNCASGKGRPAVGLERVQRIYFVRHCSNLADEACEESLLDSTALRRFVGIDLGRERVPDGTTLLKFRRLLQKHELGAQLFSRFNQTLQDRDRGLKVGTGTIVDATIIGAPSSTKNADNPHAKDFANQRIRKRREVDEAERSRNRNKSRLTSSRSGSGCAA